jgi:mRNA turnover protein 4
MGRTPEEEYHDNLRLVAKRISGSVGLLCTSRPTKEVQAYFNTLGVDQDEYARAGSTCPQRVVLTQPMVATHPVNLVDQFKKLGLPVEVQNGVMTLRCEEHVLCKEGQTLSAEQCKALVHFGIPLARFDVQLKCRWNSVDGAFEEL